MNYLFSIKIILLIIFFSNNIYAKVPDMRYKVSETTIDYPFKFWGKGNSFEFSHSINKYNNIKLKLSNPSQNILIVNVYGNLSEDNQKKYIKCYLNDFNKEIRYLIIKLKNQDSIKEDLLGVFDFEINDNKFVKFNNQMITYSNYKCFLYKPFTDKVLRKFVIEIYFTGDIKPENVYKKRISFTDFNYDNKIDLILIQDFYIDKKEEVKLYQGKEFVSWFINRNKINYKGFAVDSSEIGVLKYDSLKRQIYLIPIEGKVKKTKESFLFFMGDKLIKNFNELQIKHISAFEKEFSREILKISG